MLTDFSLSIPAGQIVAIVGDNGAGNQQTVKLLCRLYDPQSGRITWDGVDLRDLPLARLHSQISALFQQPVEYQATAAENIAYSVPESLAPGPDSVGIEPAELRGDPSQHPNNCFSNPTLPLFPKLQAAAENASADIFL